MTNTLAAHLYNQISRRNASHSSWTPEHTQTIRGHAREALTAALDLLPHGSGIDNPWTVDMFDTYAGANGEPNVGALKIRFGYHPMDESGYLSWRSYTMTACPGWGGIEVHIEDITDDVNIDDLDDTVDYLTELFQHALSQEVTWIYNDIDKHTVTATEQGWN